MGGLYGALLLRYVYSFLCPGLFSSPPIPVPGPCSIVNNPSPFHAQNSISTFSSSNQIKNPLFRFDLPSLKFKLQVKAPKLQVSGSSPISYHIISNFTSTSTSNLSPLLSTIFSLNLSIDSSDSSTQLSIPFQAGTESAIESHSLIIVEVWLVGWLVVQWHPLRHLHLRPHHTTPSLRIRIEPHPPYQKGPIYLSTNQPPTERTKTK
ncbi:hypothetical protein M422DRAFT_39412 [Sphaerobolus stellatus SS14]|uniref:Uncharacterized protein n=1 Tax=Sphaerobolus stellatus (strain SS14) TaxID=990650 RepID=A0A0C9UEF4_SPHS4|nr:hypothetical protein M422DRAFT_39412 [Sphaerobolus stellatus SS14]